MRTFFNVTFIVIFYGIFITMCCRPEWQHRYAGKVNSSITSEKMLRETEGHYMKYSFEYVDKGGNVRSSNQIESYHPRFSGYYTNSNSWVEQQLLEKGEVWVPGWRPWYIFLFAIYSVLIFVHALLFFGTCIFCSTDPELTVQYCTKCGAPGIICPLNRAVLNKDKEYFGELDFTALKQFFGYEQ